MYKAKCSNCYRKFDSMFPVHKPMLCPVCVTAGQTAAPVNDDSGLVLLDELSTADSFPVTDYSPPDPVPDAPDFGGSSDGFDGGGTGRDF